MTIVELLSFLDLDPHNCKNHRQKLSGLYANSKEVILNSVFIALSGQKYDGSLFIDQAISNGAALVLTETKISTNYSNVYHINNLKDKLPKIAKFFYPSVENIKLYAVTGTNGKTSTAYYLAQLLNGGLLSTIGIGTITNLTPSPLTTLDTISLHRVLNDMYESGITEVVMEASSHALVLNRMSGLKFKAVFFTNLSPEHLDFHNNMEEYFAAKAKLFTEYESEYAIVNIDCSYGQRLATQINHKKLITTSQMSKTLPFCQYINLINDKVVCSDNSYKIALGNNFIFDFQKSNILLAIAALIIEDRTINLESSLQLLTHAKGRMECVNTQPNVYIDYAHTSDALENVLKSLANEFKDKIITVFGCGGDRDTAKRPLMLQAALKWSRHIIITNDNPRTEDPNNIINDILSLYDKLPNNVEVILDRKLAIEKAINFANRDDTVIIAGKGCENYQIIGDLRLDFDDRAVALYALKNRNQALCKT